MEQMVELKEYNKNQEAQVEQKTIDDYETKISLLRRELETVTKTVQGYQKSGDRTVQIDSTPTETKQNDSVAKSGTSSSSLSSSSSTPTVAEVQELRNEIKGFGQTLTEIKEVTKSFQMWLKKDNNVPLSMNNTFQNSFGLSKKGKEGKKNNSQLSFGVSVQQEAQRARNTAFQGAFSHPTGGLYNSSWNSQPMLGSKRKIPQTSSDIQAWRKIPQTSSDLPLEDQQAWKNSRFKITGAFPPPYSSLVSE